MQKLFTITVKSENKPGVLYRISGIFLRRKINVEHLEVHTIEKEKKAHFSIEIFGTDEILKNVVKQIEKVIEVEEVNLS